VSLPQRDFQQVQVLDATALKQPQPDIELCAALNSCAIERDEERPSFLVANQVLHLL
jgi:hypothetical protein